MLLQVLYSVRSERQLVEQIQYNLLFRWFVGLAIEDPVWNHSVFSKNRDRLIEHDAVTELFKATVARSALNEYREHRNDRVEVRQFRRTSPLPDRQQKPTGCMTKPDSTSMPKLAFMSGTSTAC